MKTTTPVVKGPNLGPVTVKAHVLCVVERGARRGGHVAVACLVAWHVERIERMAELPSGPGAHLVVILVRCQRMR